MVDAKFIGGPLHGQRKMIREGHDLRLPIALPMILAPTGPAQMPTLHTFRYVRVDDLADGSTLFMPEGKDDRSHR